MSRINLSERTAIEAGIYGKLSLKEIAVKIGRTVKAVSREIRKNCTRVLGTHPRGNDCRNATGCKRLHLCGNMTTGPVPSSPNRRMFAMSAVHVGFAKRTALITLQLKRMPFPAAGMRTHAAVPMSRARI